MDSLDELTAREIDILQLLAKAYSNREIATELVLSMGTVKWYNKQIYQKLKVHSRQEAVAVAREKGILERETAVTPPHNLPAQITTFVGRQQEKQALINKLSEPDIRLVTVMGAGGMGKTRLVLEVGKHFVETAETPFTDGIYFVNLAPIDSPQNIVTATADALNFRFVTDQRTPKRQLLDFLRLKKMLLILDNFEHLLDGTAIVLDILHAAPHVSIFVSSRERLNLSGETLFRLEGLQYPAEQTVAHPLTYSAVQLFLQSAQRIRSDFALETKDLSHISRICHLVQGMPLGIILAATWVEVLSLAEIDHEITQSIDFLASQQRDLPRRLHSMRAVFDYSWNMMQADEANLFMKLCVFRGGFTREAAEAVAGANLHQLITLTNKSLLQREAATERYAIHELLRQYAAQRARDSNQWLAIQQQHGKYYAQLAERAEPELRGANQEQWFQTLESEHDNLRAALSWSFDDGEAIFGLRMVSALGDFWFYNGHHLEGQQWCEHALAHDTSDHLFLRGKILLALGLIRWALHQLGASQQHWEDALATFRQIGNRRYAAWALGMLGGSKWGDDPSEYRADIERIETAIRELHEVGDLAGEAQMLNILGNVHRIPQNFQQAKQAYKSCLAILRQTGEKRRECIILDNLALIAYAERDYVSAQAHAIEGIKIANLIDFKMVLVSCLHTLAGPLAVNGRVTEAVQIMGAVAAYQEAQGIRFPPNDQHYHDHIHTEVSQRLDTAAFQSAWDKGNQMSMAEAVELALYI